MTVDPTISLGAILNALVLLVGFAVAFTKIGGRIDLLTKRVGALEDRLKESGNVDKRIAVIETIIGTHGQMLAACQGEITELRHGRGFVQHRSQGGVDGEYP